LGLSKVVENCHRYLQITFAEEIYLYCQVNDLNFPELRDVLNTKWNVQILEPREGIGGHCLPKEDSKSMKSKILAAAMEVDEDYKRYRDKLYSKPERRYLLRLLYALCLYYTRDLLRVCEKMILILSTLKREMEQTSMDYSSQF